MRGGRCGARGRKAVSTSEKVFGALKTVLTLKDQVDNLGKDLGNLNARLTRLAEAHGDLRDRVSIVSAESRAICAGAAKARHRRASRRSKDDNIQGILLGM